LNFYDQLIKNRDIPLIMGILNITPDSFFDGGKFNELPLIIEKTKKMINEGVDIIDIGAVSSRPGAHAISLKEESNRLFPALIKIRDMFPQITISVDTYRHQIAEQAIKYGANIINDIYVNKDTKKMFEVIKKYNKTYVLMHMSGNPKNMQKKIYYNDFYNDIFIFLKKHITTLNTMDFHKIIIDPGFGFGKTLNQNYMLINMIPHLKKLNYPILTGVSRKSMISNALNSDANNSLHGTITANTICINKGVSIIRVHDIKAARDTVEICKLVQHNTIK